MKIMTPTDCKTSIDFDHSFGQGKKRPHEQRAIAVTIATLLVMGIEIAAGIITGSMALLADGIHMGMHALALGLTALAYIFARRYADDRRFSFGTGKSGELAGFTSALLLGISVFFLIGESVSRLLNPTTISYAEALLVASIGLVVNLVSALILNGGHEHHQCDGHHHDNNLKGALMHVLADAVTSVAAIIALVFAWKLGWNWLDPMMALIASMVILVWAWGLLRDTGRVLLDAEINGPVKEAVMKALEQDGDTRVTDLHIWTVGPGILTMVASVVTHNSHQPDHYRSLLPQELEIHHPVIEVNHCLECFITENTSQENK
jgi:cation diffusion facilitator family transporter